MREPENRVVPVEGSIREAPPVARPRAPRWFRGKDTQGWNAWTARLKTAYTGVFGVVLPAVTIGIEATTHMCADSFFDPIPTPWHVALAALVPLSVLAALKVEHPSQRALLWLRCANGAALAITAFYSLLFLPLMPIAAFAVIYAGLGLLPLSPSLALGATLLVRAKLARRARDLGFRPRLIGPTFLGFAAALLLPVAFNSPAIVTKVGLTLATSDNPTTAERGVSMLRSWGSDSTLLENCYERPDAPMDVLSTFIELSQPVSPAVARPIYYRVTGRPFNSVPAPEEFLWAWETAPRFGWDDAQGTDDVAGQVIGLALDESRLDATVDARAALSYWEWTLVFGNDSLVEREARGVVQLPPGGVVTRLTLWVDGEEREAAFSGRGETKTAYRSVVTRRLDPVLVTTAGPDRVLFQCFPVLPDGAMRIRLGITAPLVLRDAGRACLVPPRLEERNFALDETEHAVWIQSRTSAAVAPAGMREEPLSESDGMLALRGTLSDDALSDLATSFEYPRPADEREHWALALDGPGSVRQLIETRVVEPPKRLAIVVDGSVSMSDHADAIAAALEGLPAGLPVAVWIAGDHVEQLQAWEPAPSACLDELRRFRFTGGRDSAPALLAALDSIPLNESAALLWLHGPQPDLLQETTALEQLLERRTEPVSVEAVQIALGPNKVLDVLDRSTRVRVVPRVGTLADDLAPLLRAWSGTATHGFSRERFDSEPPAAANLVSSHLPRLWALDAVHAHLESGTESARVQARSLAVKHQLVTAVTGAVVLETAEQYEQAGLQPVDPDSVPSVPEPETWLLQIVAGLALVIAARFRRRAAQGRA